VSYVQEVADLFLRRFSNIHILGAEDYTKIADWEKREIPVQIVERAIEEVQSDAILKDTKIESVTDLDETVMKNFRDWLTQI
jgi:hypothetical protein